VTFLTPPFRNTYVLLRAMATSGLLFLPSAAQTVHLTPGQNVAALVASSPAGTTFLFAPGTYRLQATIQPKDKDSFEGQGNVVLSGAQQLQFHQEGEYWTAQMRLQTGDPKKCAAAHPMCYIYNDLFMDNHFHAPVSGLNQLDRTTWYYDAASQKLYVSINPAQHDVEISTIAAAFASKAIHVSISHLAVEKFASPAQWGAIGGYSLPMYWSISNVEARWNHGGGVHIGANSILESSYIHHNGQIGVGGNGIGVVIRNNEIAYNNYAGYDPGWEAGATKFGGTDGLLVQSNYVHDNAGNGLWTDGDNIRATIENNTILNNAGQGIRHEVSYDAIIRNNVVRGNTDGIVIALSSNVQVYENWVELPANGRYGLDVDGGSRGTGKYGPHISHDISFSKNTVVYTSTGRSGFNGPDPENSRISFNNNEYHVLNGNDANRWSWGKMMGLTDIQRTGLEADGKFFNSPPKQAPKIIVATPVRIE
jgi:parallel beta-helix repeat protein